MTFWASTPTDAEVCQTYAQLGVEMKKAFEAYKREVETGAFPDKEHSY